MTFLGKCHPAFLKRIMDVSSQLTIPCRNRHEFHLGGDLSSFTGRSFSFCKLTLSEEKNGLVFSSGLDYGYEQHQKELALFMDHSRICRFGWFILFGLYFR